MTHYLEALTIELPALALFWANQTSISWSLMASSHPAERTVHILTARTATERNDDV